MLRERYGILIPVMDDQKNLDPNEITEEEKQLAALLEELLTEEAKLQELSRCAKERADQFDDKGIPGQNPADCRAFQNVIHYGGTDKMRILQSRILFHEKNRRNIPMQKIAFHLNSLQQGGAERVVSNLANRFAKEGYEVVIATEWYGTDEFALDQKVRRVHVGLTKEDENRSRISKMLRRIWYLRRFMKKEKPDVVVAFTRGVLYRALAAGIGTGIPVVISVRTDPVGHYDKKADKLRIPLLFPHAAGCVFQTEGAKAFFAPYLQENSRIILNPLNPKYVGVPEPAVRTKDVVQSGRLVDFKNQPMLIRAFLKVHEKHPDYALKIYGPDSKDGTKEILESIIHENHAEDFVKLMGGSNTLEKDLAERCAVRFFL